MTELELLWELCLSAGSGADHLDAQLLQLCSHPRLVLSALIV